MGFLTAALVTASVASSVAQGIGARKAANAATAEGARLAADARARGEEDVTRYRRDLDQIVSQQRVISAASGVDINSGTAGAVQKDTRAIGELDIQTIRENARREAYGLRANSEVNAKSMRAGANAAFASAGMTLLTAGVDAWSKYSAGKSAMNSARMAGGPSAIGRSSSVASRPAFSPVRP